ncbi:phytanoyl-CoA dioxygenase family protein [Chitinimonas viridis]|uniref:Phytanoyl-CoA dioxygenase family protein n=1 Tax=Chitinimonas viridis TaxID=664880 RepID=A0ABT8B8I1_9NEIS|nr:phytanoyl-CoA dioxygenase family protein [Chitinimonas viridis]MDN3577814.1 phytanoyl-CoA dioxygenase family protein [Chitinimonas viridis]
MLPARYQQQGYAISDPLLTEQECDALAAQLSAQHGLADDQAGNRQLLQYAWCRALAQRLQQHPALACLLPPGLVAVQCTLFEKSLDRNWLVALHQDLSIPLGARVDAPELTSWSFKQGGWYVQPPLSVLQGLLAVRLHIDACGPHDGALRVIPGTHRLGILDPAARLSCQAVQAAVLCPVARGAAMVMQPLLLHASSKATGNSRRRVLHFLFGPVQLPLGMAWPDFPID